MNAVITTTAPLAYSDLERLANSIAKSGLFGIKTPDQAMALMMIAAAEGQHPALAARDYDVIQGRPAKKAEAMMRDFLAAGGKCEWHTLSDTLADATFTHPQTGSVRIDWDTARAATAGLTSKDNYKKFPRQMLRSRVVSEGVRTLWPLATSGMHVPEEVREFDRAEPFDGKTIDHAEEAPSPPLRAAAAPTPRAARKVAAEDFNPPDTPHDRWMALLRAAMAKTTSAAEAEEVGERESVRNYMKAATEAQRMDISDVLAKGYARHVTPATRETPDDLEIAGEAYLAAG